MSPARVSVPIVIPILVGNSLFDISLSFFFLEEFMNFWLSSLASCNRLWEDPSLALEQRRKLDRFARAVTCGKFGRGTLGTTEEHSSSSSSSSSSSNSSSRRSSNNQVEGS